MSASKDRRNETTRSECKKSSPETRPNLCRIQYTKNTGKGVCTCNTRSPPSQSAQESAGSDLKHPMLFANKRTRLLSSNRCSFLLNHREHTRAVIDKVRHVDAAAIFRRINSRTDADSRNKAGYKTTELVLSTPYSIVATLHLYSSRKTAGPKHREVSRNPDFEGSFPLDIKIKYCCFQSPASERACSGTIKRLSPPRGIAAASRFCP